jgi:hypothetical protein
MTSLFTRSVDEDTSPPVGASNLLSEMTFEEGFHLTSVARHSWKPARLQDLGFATQDRSWCAFIGETAGLGLRRQGHFASKRERGLVRFGNTV